jgi:hypothetical protein
MMILGSDKERLNSLFYDLDVYKHFNLIFKNTVHGSQFFGHHLHVQLH